MTEEKKEFWDALENVRRAFKDIDPDNAPSDGPNMIRLDNFEKILYDLVELDYISKRSLRR